MNKKNLFIMFAFSALVISTMTALGIDHMRSVNMCHDVRLYMDGSYGAKVESGGLTPHSDLTLYRLVNMKNVKIEEEPVSRERRIINGLPGEFYSSSRVQLFIPDQQISTKASAALLDASLPAEKIKASLICQKRS